MKRFFFLLFCFPLFLSAQEIHQRNLLSKNLTAAQLSEMLVPADQWRYFPPYTDRQAWQNLPEPVKEAILEQGNEALEFDWPALPATLYLEFTRNGNRSNYQAVYFERRAKLADLVLAETLTGSGIYLDQIVNGIWAICEESSWCIPAHLALQESGHTGLPAHDDMAVDLFAAETGTTIAWTYYLMKDQLETISPAINSRIRTDIRKRILEPVMERTDFWWMGLGERKNVNNWNPWVISNWLTVALLMEPDPDLRAKSIYKAITCLDNFINIQPDDGGCDEGPGYWGRAGASLFDCLDILYSATNGKIDLFGHPLIRNTGTYITKAYIKQPFFINFADASAKTKPDPGIVYRYGKAVKDEDMMGFGGFLLQQNGVNFGGSYSFGRQLNAIHHYEELLKAPVAEPLPQDVWLPDLQVFAARDKAGTAVGFYIAGKGGHNAESHNHNDVGNYMIFYNGLPVIIDVGVEEYRKETFSSQRYSIWTMQSQYHTLPTINGQMQAPGRDHKSKAVHYKANDKKMEFSLDIAGAYPAEAAVNSWLRSVELERGKTVRISENYDLQEVMGELSLFFVTPCLPEIDPEGLVRLREKDGAFSINLTFDGKSMEASTESITVEDRRLLPVWGDLLYRIKLQVKEPKKKGELKYGFQVGG